MRARDKLVLSLCLLAVGCPEPESPESSEPLSGLPVSPPCSLSSEVALAESFFARDRELDVDQTLFLARHFNRWIARDEPELLDGPDPERQPVEALYQALAPRRSGVVAEART